MAGDRKCLARSMVVDWNHMVEKCGSIFTCKWEVPVRTRVPLKAAGKCARHMSANRIRGRQEFPNRRRGINVIEQRQRAPRVDEGGGGADNESVLSIV